MKSILYSICIGSLALALTAGAAQAATEKRPERAKPQQRTANVQAARPANTGRTMSVHRNVSATQYRQRSNAKPRNSSAVNHAPRPASAKPATTRERNLAVNRDRNVAVNRTRNFDANRERNLAVNRAKNADVNRYRNANEFRGRNNVAINRNRKVAVNRTGNAAYYRGGNARITNNWRGDAFRGQRYAAFRNYNRQWHDRSWWRSHYDRIVFVNNGWYYWNAGYWFPAWGYAPSVSYVYDGPIYGC